MLFCKDTGVTSRPEPGLGAGQCVGKRVKGLEHPSTSTGEGQLAGCSLPHSPCLQKGAASCRRWETRLRPDTRGRVTWAPTGRLGMEGRLQPAPVDRAAGCGPASLGAPRQQCWGRGPALQTGPGPGAHALQASLLPFPRWGSWVQGWSPARCGSLWKESPTPWSVVCAARNPSWSGGRSICLNASKQKYLWSLLTFQKGRAGGLGGSGRHSRRLPPFPQWTFIRSDAHQGQAGPQGFSTC